MLYMKNQRISRTLCAQNGGAHCTSQISRRRTHGGRWVDRTQVGHQHPARCRAVFVLACRQPGQKGHHRYHRNRLSRAYKAHILLQLLQEACGPEKRATRPPIPSLEIRA